MDGVKLAKFVENFGVQDAIAIGPLPGCWFFFFQKKKIIMFEMDKLYIEKGRGIHSYRKGLNKGK